MNRVEGEAAGGAAGGHVDEALARKVFAQSCKHLCSIAALEAERRKSRRLEDRVQCLELQLAEARMQDSLMFTSSTNNAFYDKLSVWGGVNIALKRALTGVAGYKLGVYFGRDCSPQHSHHCGKTRLLQPSSLHPSNFMYLPEPLLLVAKTMTPSVPFLITWCGLTPRILQCGKSAS